MSKHEISPEVLRSSWSREAIDQFYSNRRSILIEADSAGGVILLESLVDDEQRVLAATSLVQEGFAMIDDQNPEALKLTEQGQERAIGAVALQYE